VALDLLLVVPGAGKKIYGDLARSVAAVEPPLWAGLMAAYARDKGYAVAVVDAAAENLSADEVAERIAAAAPALAGVVVSGTNPSASTMNMTEARRILEAVGERNIRAATFLSGLHPSSVPERTMREEPVDYVIRGETFYTLPPLIEYAKGGSTGPGRSAIPGLWYRDGDTIRSNPAAPLVADLDDLPTMAWDLLPMDRYRAHNWHCFDHPDRRSPYATMYTSLGCPYSCSFCCINAVFGKPGIRYRSPGRVLEEIGVLVETYGVRNIKIMDEMFVLDKKHVVAICDGIVERGYDLNIWAYARIDTITEEMLARLKAAGFNWLAYGIEAGSETVRSGVAKGRFGKDAIRETIRKTRAAGIAVGANYIFGLPDDDRDSMRETLDLAMELNCEYANFYVAMAYPGSKLYDDAIAAGGKGLPDRWEGYAQLGYETLPLPTAHLSPGEILAFRDEAFRRYHSDPRYLAMLRERFGEGAVEDIGRMLAHTIARRYAPSGRPE
jgi:radical SAM superfamily enzyme YgiQ (UPF0313 family)